METFFLLIQRINSQDGTYFVLETIDIFTEKIITIRGVMSTVKIGAVYAFSLEKQSRVKANTEKGTISFYIIKNYSTILKSHLIEYPQLQRVFFNTFLPDHMVNFVTDCIFEKFGVDTPLILLRDIDRLKEVECVSDTLLERYKDITREFYTLPSIDSYLYNIGVDFQRAIVINEKLKDTFFTELYKNPYLLTFLGGVSPSHVEKTSDKDYFSVEYNSIERLSANLFHELEKFATSSGDLYVSIDVLMDSFKTKYIPPFEITRESMEKCLEYLNDKGFIKLDRVKNIISSMYFYDLEVDLFERLRSKLDNTYNLSIDIEKIRNTVLNSKGVLLSKEQLGVLEKISQNGCLLLSGQAGTGKTTVVKAIQMLLRVNNIPYVFLSSTGRASKVLSKVLDDKVITVHKFLKFSGRGFAYNKTNKITDYRFVLVDEASMCDAVLTHSLLTAIPDGCKVMFVGDVNQLPPVGPGGILESLFSTGYIPSYTLTEIFRQAKGSEILNQADRVLNSKSYERVSENGYSFVDVSDNPEHTYGEILKLYEVCKKKGKSFVSISPMKKGPFGVFEINKFIQSRVNNNANKSSSKFYRSFGHKIYENDHVLFIKNDFENDVCNGDVGYVRYISNQGITFFIDNRELIYSFDKASNSTDLAYCITVHKSQGSEYDVVALVLHENHKYMLSINLIYTAFTRSKKHLFVFSSEVCRCYRKVGRSLLTTKNTWIPILFDKSKNK